LLAINGVAPQSCLEAAQMLREGIGEMRLCVQRGGDPIGKAKEKAGGGGGGAGVAEEGEGVEDALSTAVGDLEDLSFLCSRLAAHEAQLTARQELTAMALERAMASVGAQPPPLSEEEMADGVRVEEYMVQMGRHSAMQRLQLSRHAPTVEENQLLSRQLCEVAQIKRWLDETAVWLRAEMEVWLEGGDEEESAPPMLSEEDIAYMELVDEQLCELLDEPHNSPEETGEERTGEATGEDGRGEEMWKERESPPGLEEVRDAAALPLDVANRSDCYSRPSGDMPAHKAPGPIKRSSSFSRRGKPSAAPEGQGAGGVVARSSSFALRKPLGLDAGTREHLIAQRLERARRNKGGEAESEDDEVGCQVHPI
ncbi:MAG: hypothetical protein SGPRY_014234, partial [Prymnesium sp.]